MGSSGSATTTSGDSMMNRDTAKTSSAAIGRTDSNGDSTKPAKAAPVKPKVRPNIDPGRIPAKPKTLPAKSPAPAPDSGAGSAGSDSSGSASAATPSSSAAGQENPDLKYDAASNTVTFQLIGGPTGFQFNGHSSGSATLTLPPKANVVINFINKDGTPHSAEVIPGEGPIPNSGGDPAIPRAYTNQLLQGLPQEGTDVMRFTVPDSGTYRIFCGVPGHGLSGMWIWMKVDPAAKTPSFGATKS
jgi:hypothetical protein